MAYENTLEEYFEQHPESKLKIFKILVRMITIVPIVIALGVFLYILIQFGII